MKRLISPLISDVKLGNTTTNTLYKEMPAYLEYAHRHQTEEVYVEVRYKKIVHPTKTGK